MKAAIDFSGIRWYYLSGDGRAWLAEQNTSLLHGGEVRSTEKRRVLRCPGTYVKEIEYQGIQRIVKSLLGGTACKEGRKSLLLRQKGISTSHVLAYGQEFHRGLIRRDILVTKEVRAAKRLYDVVFDEYRNYKFREKIHLIRSLAGFIQSLHRGGILHYDLHMGNILVRRDEYEWRFFLLDSDRVKFFPSYISQEKKADNLSLLLVNFQKLTTRTERFRFLKFYCQHEGASRLDKQFLIKIDKKALKRSKHSWHKRAFRSLENNAKFLCINKNKYKVHLYRSEINSQIFDALFPDPDEALENGDIVKSGRTVKASIVSDGLKDYFLKRYNDKGIYYQIRNAFRVSRAIRTWVLSWEYFYRGIPVPKPLVCIEERKFRLLKRSYLLYDYVKDSKSLSRMWGSFDQETRKSIIVILAIKIGWMHRTGCIHGDLKWNNILLDGSKRVFLIDFDGSRIPFISSTRKKNKDINRFLKDLRKFEDDSRFEQIFMDIWKRWSGASI